MTRADLLRAITVAAAAGLLASCGFAPTPGPTLASKEYFSPAKYGTASPKVVADAKPVPKGGGHYVVGEAYRVAGKTYVPRDNPRYSKVGLASWYGSAFHGRLTANGEVYDVNALTAAHPTMPLPSYARVTNLTNGRSVIVRVNDRGPFAHDRLIDVSAATADLLDFKQSGTAKVKVDYIGPARMDGLDQNRLLASYRGPGSATPGRGFTQFAANDQKPESGFVLASAAAPAPRVRPGEAFDGPLMLTPQYATTAAYTEGGDTLGSLILRSGLSRSYAEQPQPTRAQNAAAELSSHDLTTALTAAAARKASQMAAANGSAANGAVVQLGSFSSPDNARRIAEQFSRYGRTELQPRGNVQVVLVTVAGNSSPDAVIDAASAIGLNGAFVLQR